jgi:hypothetical protein
VGGQKQQLVVKAGLPIRRQKRYNVPPNHAFNRPRRYGFYLASASGGGPAKLDSLGVTTEPRRASRAKGHRRRERHA